MKRTFLACSLAVCGFFLQAQASPLAGCFPLTPPGSWSEFLIAGQPGTVGNEIKAWGPNYVFEGATLAVVTNDVSGEWDWITKYENATLLLTNLQDAPWFSACDTAEAFQVEFPEVWVKTRSTRYASTNDGYLEFELLALTDTVQIRATYAGTPTYTVVNTNDVLASDQLATAEICIGKVVQVDIRPGSGPNPLNVRSRGVLPVAIRGSADFDVTQIEPSSLRFQCDVPALRWNYSVSSCTQSTNLLLKFETQAIVASLPPVEYRDIIKLVLTGELKDGTPISGSDSILILGKPKKDKDCNGKGPKDKDPKAKGTKGKHN